MGQRLAVCCTTDDYETLQLRDSCSRRPSKLVQITPNDNRSTISSISQEELYSNDILSPIRTSSFGELYSFPESLMATDSMQLMQTYATTETWDDDIGEPEMGFERKETSLRQLISEYDNEIQNYKEYLGQ